MRVVTKVCCVLKKVPPALKDPKLVVAKLMTLFSAHVKTGAMVFLHTAFASSRMRVWCHRVASLVLR